MDKNILVFGSYVTDLSARSKGFPRAGETIRGNNFHMGPGGKGSNQAVAALRAGGNVTFITKLGDDVLGRQALDFYAAEGLDIGNVLVDPNAQTGAALIMVDEQTGQNQIVVAGGACVTITDDETRAVLALVEKAGLLLVQLETNLEPVFTLLRHAHACGVPAVLNPAPVSALDEDILRCVDIITPNESEAESLTGVPVTDEASARAAAQKLHASGVARVVVTLGKQGCFASDGTNGQFFPIVDCGPPVDSTGAGDAFTGGLVAALARGMGFFEAVLYGSCTSGLAVTRPGTAPAMPCREEIERIYNTVARKRNSHE